MVMSLSYLSKWTDDGHRLFNHQVWAAITDNRNQAGADAQPTLPPDARALRLGRERLEHHPLDAPLEEDGGAQWILPENIPNEGLRSACRDDPDRERVRGSDLIASRARGDQCPLPQGQHPRRNRPLAFSSSAASRSSCSGCTVAGCWPLVARTGWNMPRPCSYPRPSWGCLALQLKQIVAGKDPVSMDPHENPSFYAKAAFQGGGLGIMGDFLNSATSRTGQDFWTSQLGPVVGSIDDVRQLLTAGRERREEGQARQERPTPCAA
jgi:hypothetical protein